MLSLVKYMPYKWLHLTSLLQPCSRLALHVMERSCSSADQPTMKYDINTYQVPITQEETKTILHTINNASLQELMSYKLSKTVANKLIVSRKKKAQFEDIKQLLFVDGLGLKKIESLCKNILNKTDTQIINNQVKTTKVHRKSYHNPRITDKDLEDTVTVVGLHVKSSSVSWCELQRRMSFPKDASLATECNWHVVKLDSANIPQVKHDMGHLYNNAKEIVSRLPTSSDCVFIIPERLIQAKDITPDLFPLAVATSQLGGILGALLSTAAPLYYTKESAVATALTLENTNGQRVRGSQAASCLLAGKVSSPLAHLHISPQLTKSYSLSSEALQYTFSSALYMALTFSHLR